MLDFTSGCKTKKIARKIHIKIRMEVEKITPVAISPLDSCRGRGRHNLMPRIRGARPRHSPTVNTDDDTLNVVLLVIQEPLTKIGGPKDVCIQSGKH